MKYDIDYFIKKFEAIPEEKWHTKHFRNKEGDKFCALGHCNQRLASKHTEESQALYSIDERIALINDGKNLFKRIGKTPKERVINHLKKLKSLDKTE